MYNNVVFISFHLVIFLATDPAHCAPNSKVNLSGLKAKYNFTHIIRN